jgi:hypothetical protein
MYQYEPLAGRGPLGGCCLGRHAELALPRGLQDPPAMHAQAPPEREHLLMHLHRAEIGCDGMQHKHVHASKASKQGKGMRVATVCLLRAAMMCSSCWGASSLSRLARDSCAAAASLKQLLDTQKLYKTCTSDMLPWSFCHAQRHPTP